MRKSLISITALLLIPCISAATSRLKFQTDCFKEQALAAHLTGAVWTGDSLHDTTRIRVIELWKSAAKIDPKVVHIAPDFWTWLQEKDARVLASYEANLDTYRTTFLRIRWWIKRVTGNLIPEPEHLKTEELVKAGIEFGDPELIHDERLLLAREEPRESALILGVGRGLEHSLLEYVLSHRRVVLAEINDQSLYVAVERIERELELLYPTEPETVRLYMERIEPIQIDLGGILSDLTPYTESVIAASRPTSELRRLAIRAVTRRLERYPHDSLQSSLLDGSYDLVVCSLISSQWFALASQYTEKRLTDHFGALDAAEAEALRGAFQRLAVAFLPHQAVRLNSWTHADSLVYWGDATEKLYASGLERSAVSTLPFETFLRHLRDFFRVQTLDKWDSVNTHRTTPAGFSYVSLDLESKKQPPDASAESQWRYKALMNFEHIPARVKATLHEANLLELAGTLTAFKTWKALQGTLGKVSFDYYRVAIQNIFVALKEKPLPITLLDEAIIRKAAEDRNGAWDLARRIHPYTVQSLAEDGAFTSRFKLHEGMYYKLYAEKLLGRLPPHGAVIINIDSHTDEYLEEHPYGSSIPHSENGNPVHMGVRDSNWAEAAVADGLAEYVITMRASGNYVVISKEDGVIRKQTYEIIPPHYLEWAKNRLWLTVDLDLFSLSQDRAAQPRAFDLEASAKIVDQMVTSLMRFEEKYDFQLQGLVIAESPEYLADRRPEYVEGLKNLIQQKFEFAFASERWYPKIIEIIRAVVDGLKPDITITEFHMEALINSMISGKLNGARVVAIFGGNNNFVSIGKVRDISKQLKLFYAA